MFVVRAKLVRSDSIQPFTTVDECRNLYFAFEKAIRPGSVTGASPNEC